MLPVVCREETSKVALLYHTLLHDGSALLTLRTWAETSEVKMDLSSFPPPKLFLPGLNVTTKTHPEQSPGE